MDIRRCIAERRGRVIHVTDIDVIKAFTQPKEGYVQLCYFDLPEDYVIYRVNKNYETDTFAFLLLHDSYDHVGHGDAYPIIHAELRLFEYIINKDRPERLDETWQKELKSSEERKQPEE